MRDPRIINIKFEDKNKEYANMLENDPFNENIETLHEEVLTLAWVLGVI